MQTQEFRGAQNRTRPQTKTEYNSRAADPANAGQKAKDYKDYKIWQLGIEIVDAVYSATDQFPKDEADALAAQMRKSAVSIPSDVAEGYVRRYANGYTEFLYGALGACARLDTQLFIAEKRKYVRPEHMKLLSEQINHECRMLVCLIKKVKSDDQPRRQNPEPAPRF